jgi:hypothetical protein
MHRLVTAVFLAICVISLPQSTRAGCEIVACWRECTPVPGGRYCVRRCRHHCRQPAPRYVPPASPHYYAPQQHYAPPLQFSAPEIDRALVAAALFIGLVGFLIHLFTNMTTATQSREITMIDTDTARTNDLARRYEDLEREAQEHINSMIEKAQRGHHHE